MAVYVFTVLGHILTACDLPMGFLWTRCCKQGLLALFLAMHWIHFGLGFDPSQSTKRKIAELSNGTKSAIRELHNLKTSYPTRTTPETTSPFTLLSYATKRSVNSTPALPVIFDWASEPVLTTHVLVYNASRNGTQVICGNISCGSNATIEKVCVEVNCTDMEPCVVRINCTFPTDSPGPKYKLSHSDYQLIDKLLMAGFSLIFVIGTWGNATVCYLFGWVKRKQRKIPETLFLYLAIVDLLSSVANPFFFLYLNATKYSRWDFGYVGCKVLASIGPVTTSLSAIFICIIAIDRYFVIVNPFGRRYGKKHINIACLIAIPIATFMHLHYIYYVEYSKTFESCLVEKVTLTFKICSIATFVVQDYMCLFIFLFTSISIARKLNENSNILHLERISKQRQVEQKAIVRILTLMGTLFFLFVLPRDLFHVIYTISWLVDKGISYTLHVMYVNSALKILHTANSCINIFIYSRMHKQFRMKTCAVDLCCPERKLRRQTGTAFTLRTHLDSLDTLDTQSTRKSNNVTPSPVLRSTEKGKHVDVTKL